MQLNEVDVEAEFLKTSDASCDVACLMYDTSDPHSFDYCASIYKVGHRIDCTRVCIIIIAIIIGISASKITVFLYLSVQTVNFCFSICLKFAIFTRIFHSL